MTTPIRTPRGAWKRLLLVASPLALAVALVAGIACGGGDSAPEPTVEVTVLPTATTGPSVEDVLRYFAAVWPTATPEPQQVSSSGGGGGGGGGGSTTGGGTPYQPRPVGTGPGPIVGTDMTIVSAAANLNANVSARSVGSTGQMGDPIGAWMALWYDFSEWGGLGGYPGQPGANAVFAGHVDYIGVGPAVFYGTRNLVAGDQVTVNTAAGPVTYVIQWSAAVGPYDDFTAYVEQTGEEIITLVTCVGEFSGGHYTQRLIVRGKRI